MIHGPCGNLNRLSPYMKDGKCIKQYPRALIHDTLTADDGYPQYRRRMPGLGEHFAIIQHGGTEIEIDNRWIVPYCPLPSKIFNTHLNVKYCHSIKSIKYICKYIHKGSDQAAFVIENSRDEVTIFQTGRYISSNEAVWRILGLPVHQRHPSVTHLSVHLENGQRVYFNEENIKQRAQEPPRTTLTEFFKACQNDEFAQTLLYYQMPTYYTWTAQKKWQSRKQGKVVENWPHICASDVLGRVYTVYPTNLECLHLRILLHKVTGPTLFQQLRTVDGIVCSTFKEACLNRGLLEDDRQWRNTLQEASVSDSPSQLRNLFAIILISCNPSDPKQLWLDHRESMSDDVCRQLNQLQPQISLDFTAEIFNKALTLLEGKVINISGKRLEQHGFTSPCRDLDLLPQTELLQETNYVMAKLDRIVSSTEPNLTFDQDSVYGKILKAVDDELEAIFFLDAPGGTSKTFLLNLLLAKIRSNRQVALAVTSLLEGGRTSHSMFKLPLDMGHLKTPVCNIRKGTGLAQLLQTTKLIVWDECTMAHKATMEALNRTLKDLYNSDKLMGGVCVLLAGDFRQILLVIPRGTPADELKACLKNSYLWHRVEVCKLTTNMRVHMRGDDALGEFSAQLLNIGEGKLPVNNGLICLPDNCRFIVDTEDNLLQKVYPNIHENYLQHQWLKERVILAPKNDTVDHINQLLLEKSPGTTTSFLSIDCVVEENDSVNYPAEFLNSLQPASMRPHNLQLCVGAPVMLL
ncbi:uncharacterized protein [Watersipora subatra]|uniref:uncharacterized protein n=1 Tax=Watersipora subatra TaxID=2589382 RepID=UPI00355BBD23